MGKAKGIERLEIKKKSSEEIACWIVDSEGLAPNTEIVPDKGITVFVRIDGGRPMIFTQKKTVFAQLNPGKNTKLFGGMTPYEKCDVYAIDQSSEYYAEWGLAGNQAIPCLDFDFKVDCKAVATGKYYYKIENLFDFIATVPFDSNGEISRDSIREYLRDETSGIIRSVLSAAIMGKDLLKCQANVGQYAVDIKDEIEKKLKNKGITVYNFVIAKLDYAPDHLANREKLKKAKVEGKIKSVENETKRDDLGLDIERAKGIDALHRDADNGYSVYDGGKSAPAPKGNANAHGSAKGGEVVCPRCKEKNAAGTNYCARCGEKLN